MKILLQKFDKHQCRMTAEGFDYKHTLVEVAEYFGVSVEQTESNIIKSCTELLDKMI